MKSLQNECTECPKNQNKKKKCVLLWKPEDLFPPKIGGSAQWVCCMSQVSSNLISLIIISSGEAFIRNNTISTHSLSNADKCPTIMRKQNPTSIYATLFFFYKHMRFLTRGSIKHMNVLNFEEGLCRGSMCLIFTTKIWDPLCA